MLVHFLALSTRLCMTGGFFLHYFILLLFSPCISFIFFHLSVSCPLWPSHFLHHFSDPEPLKPIWGRLLTGPARILIENMTDILTPMSMLMLTAHTVRKETSPSSRFFPQESLFVFKHPPYSIQYIYITSILWDSNVEHGEKDRENNQSNLATLRSLPDSALCLSKPGKLSVKKFQQHVPEHCGVHIFHPLPSALQ